LEEGIKRISVCLFSAVLAALIVVGPLLSVYSPHDIGLARKIGDRIGVMRAGRLIEVGPAAAVINRPGHPYTRLLMAGASGHAEACPALDPGPEKLSRNPASGGGHGPFPPFHRKSAHPIFGEASPLKRQR